MTTPSSSRIEPTISTSRPLQTIDRVVPVDMGWALRRTLLLGLIFSALWACLMWIYYLGESANNQNVLESGQERIQRLATLTAHEEMAAVLSDLRYLSRHNALSDFLEDGGPAAERHLASEYVHFLAQKRDYDQIRLLALDGQERVRVNHARDGVAIVPPQQLQNKKDRYYFPEIMKLGEGQIYVSPLDLNVENGAVEQPLKPVIRFAAPVFDEAGRRRGLIVLNYRADRLFGHIRAVAGAPRDVWLVNREGFWLMGPESGDEWGFMLPGREARSFASRYPLTWRQIGRDSAGTRQEGGLLLNYQRIFPLAWHAGDADAVGLARPVDAERYQLTLISVITPQDLRAMDARLIHRLAMIYLVLVLFSFAVAGALSWFSARNLALLRIVGKVVDNVPMLVSYVDVGLRYRFNNLTYLDWFGTPPRQLYGGKIRDALGEAAYQSVLPYVERALAGQRVDFEQRLDYTAGGPREVTVSYLPDVAGNGEVRGFYAVVNDITQLKETQRLERQHMLELAHVSRLASVGEVTTEIAHQVNQPLAAIAMFSAAALRTLREGGDANRVLDWLEQINAQSQRAGEVVKRLRRFARKGETQRGPVSLTQLAREVLVLTEHTAHGQGVEMRLDLDEHLPLVQADRVLLEQVIYNLVRNALDAVAGQPDPRCVEMRTGSEGGRVFLAVADTGPGVRETLGQDIFASFTTQKSNGLGIGLSISRSIIEAHGGDITYANRPAGGAVFRFTLPGANREQ